MPTPASLVIRDFLSHQQPAQTDFLQALVQVPSDNPSGDCAPHAARAQTLLEALGFAVRAYPVPQKLVGACGMRSATNLIVRHVFGAGTGPVIALNAHGDVVPPGAGWTHDPYGGEIVQDAEHGPVMFGRGVAVSKSDFATYTWALLALREAERQGASFDGTVELHFTYDEETGGEIGPKYLLDAGLSAPDFALSAGFSYGITSAHNGCLHVEVTVHGKQAHAAMPHTGVDALEAATHILRALYDFRAALAQTHSATPGIDTPGLNVGLISGGINTNVVPDTVNFRVDRRMIPEEAGHDAEHELRTLIETAAAERPGITVDVRRIMLAQPLAQLPGAEILIDALRAHAQAAFNTEIPVQGVPLYTDARHYTHRGIPTVLYGAGPRTLMEARGHNTDENLRLNDLYGATRVVALTLADLLAAKSATSARG
ncbi:M20/M25/M40 family metallo-hydrolase [Schauerella aestuarii]|uniref:M20/M25/M40 family metallo-hydrolase n=1 Tax=Schauerella aestuarii TaxID=2511204 RepID=UPI00136E300C|nr:M20/M25/M40 family metallo-hydrolase [Achromobacter aestuarii]MYZ42024.1 M20/M25/M40 family metallo-hydrolase [Achromobacter aestuarii]